MVSVPARREQVAFAAKRGLSQRRACTLIKVARSALRYRSRLVAKDAHECLLEVEPLFVNRPRTTAAPRLDPALELYEGAEMFVEMKIGMRHVALEQK